MSDYFIAIDGQQQGPFPAVDLPARGMRADSMVWCDGMGDWQRAEQVMELATLLPGRRPPPAVPYPSSSPPTPYGPPPYGQVPFPQSMPPMGYANSPMYVPANSNRVAAGICGILLGGLGVHKFILGQVGAGLIMFFCNFPTCGIMHIIGIIEGVIYLTKTDAEFHQIYVVQRRAWF